MTTTAVFAWIGLGTMGGPMAANLVAAGHEVRGYDLSEVARGAAEKSGVKVAASIADAVRDADAVFTILPAAGHVRSVYAGEDGIWAHAPRTALLVDASTVDVGTSRWCHDESASRGFTFVDSPVSGGVPGAVEGTLTFMTGGRPEAVERLTALVEPMAGSVIKAGGPTSGIAAKICNNMMLFISLMATAEGSQLAQHLGLDPKVFWQIVSVSSGRSWPQETWYPIPGVVDSAPANRNFEAAFSAEGALKDMSLALHAGEQTGVRLPGAQLVADQFRELTNQGLGHKDCSMIAKLVAPGGVIEGFTPQG